MVYSTLLQQIGIMFFMVAVGIFAKKRGILSEDAQGHARELLLRIASPMMILGASEVGGDGDASMKINLLIAMLAAIIYLISLGLIGQALVRFAKIKDSDRVAFRVNFVLGNSGFFALPLAAALFGPEGAFYAAIGNVVSITGTFTYGIFLMSKSKGLQWKRVLLNPSTIASFMVMFIVLLQISLPPMVITACKSLGVLCTPLSMLLLGAIIADTPFIGYFNEKSGYLLCLGRLVVMPIVFMGAMYVLKFDRILALSLSVFAGAPCGALNSIFAKQFNCNPQLFSKYAAQSMVFTVITVPLLLFIGNHLWMAT